MSQILCEEWNFIVVFIGVVKGNYNLMFVMCVGRNMNFCIKIKLSGRNFFYVVVFGGSKSCVVNIFMNGGNVLLEVLDNMGEILINGGEIIW